MKIEALDYASPQVHKPRRAMLPFVILALSIAAIALDMVDLTAIAGGAGGGMNAAQRNELRIEGELFSCSAYLGLSLGLLLGGFVAVRWRGYGHASLACACLGTIIFILPPILWYCGRIDLLMYFFK